MAGFWYFLPDCATADLAVNGSINLPAVRARGLAGVFRDVRRHPEHAILQDIRKGPDELPGVLVYPVPPSGQTPKNPGLDMAAQTFRKVGDGSYWLAWSTDDPPKPDDLMRRQMVEGHSIEDGQGHAWTIPVGRADWNTKGTLPTAYGFDEDDEPIVTVAAEYRDFYENCKRLWDIIFDKTSLEDGLFYHTFTEEEDAFCLRMILQALEVNYRVNKHVFATIEMCWPSWLTQQASRSMLHAITDFSVYRQFIEQQKKTSTPSAADGLISTTGTQAETPITAPA